MPQSHTQQQNVYEQFLSVRKVLAESTASYWSDLEIFHELNQAQQFIQRKTKYLKKTVTVTTVASTSEYDLRSNSFSDIMDITEDGVSFKVNGTTYMPLTYTTRKELNDECPGWRSAVAGTPFKYYYDKASKTIGLFPKPSSTNVGAYLDVLGYYYPQALLGGTAASGSTTTIVLPVGSTTVNYPSTTDDYYNGLYIQIYSGAGAGQTAKITDYVASTRTCTASFTDAPSSNSVFGMISPLPESVHYLMPLYALGGTWGKGGSRTTLGDYYWKKFINGLQLAIGESIEEDNEEIVRDSYR